MKQEILEILSDRQWHSSMEMLQRMGFRWSWQHRLNELRRETGICIEIKKVREKHFEYQLITPNGEVDFVKCCLKSKVGVRKSGQMIMSLKF